MLQVPTLVSMQGNASTPRGPSSASACRATQALAARSMSTSASPTPARMMPPVWTRSGSSSASACLVGGQPHRHLLCCWVWVVGGLLSFNLVLVWVWTHGITEKNELVEDCLVGPRGESWVSSALLWTPLVDHVGLNQAKGRETGTGQPWNSLFIRSHHL